MVENFAESEYSEQFFGITPEKFFEDFSELIVAEMSLTVQDSIKACDELGNDEAKNIVIQNLIQRHDKWSQRVEIALKKLQPVIKQFFTIPKNVLLPDDYMHAKEYTQEELDELEREYAELKEKYLEDKRAINTYKTKIAVLDKLEYVHRYVDISISQIKRFEDTLKDIKELERLTEALKEAEKRFMLGQGAVDDQMDDGYAIHAALFKVST